MFPKHLEKIGRHTIKKRMYKHEEIVEINNVTLYD